MAKAEVQKQMQRLGTPAGCRSVPGCSSEDRHLALDTGMQVQESHRDSRAGVGELLLSLFKPRWDCTALRSQPRQLTRITW